METLAIILIMIVNHFCVKHCVLNEVLKYCLVLVYSVCIHRRQYQRIRGGRRLRGRGRGGQLYQLYQSRQAILVQASKDTIAIYLFREPYLSQVFTLQACKLFSQSLFIVDLCLSLELLQELQVQSSTLKFSQYPLLVDFTHDQLLVLKFNLITLDGNC